MSTLDTVYKALEAKRAEMAAHRDLLQAELSHTANEYLALAGEKNMADELIAALNAGIEVPGAAEMLRVWAAMTDEADAAQKAAQEIWRTDPNVAALKAFEDALAKVKQPVVVTPSQSVAPQKTEKPAVEPVDHMSLSEDEKYIIAKDIRRRLMPQAKGLARERRGDLANGRDYHDAFVELGKPWMMKNGYLEKQWNYDFLVWADSKPVIDRINAEMAPKTEVKAQVVEPPVVEAPVVEQPVVAPARDMFRKERNAPRDNDMSVIDAGRKPRQAPKAEKPKGKAENKVAALVAAEMAKEAEAKVKADAEAAAIEKRHQAALKGAETRRLNKAAAEQTSQSAS